MTKEEEITRLVESYVFIDLKLKEMQNFIEFVPDTFLTQSMTKGYKINIEEKEGIYRVYPNHAQYEDVYFDVYSEEEEEKDVCSCRTSYYNIVKKIKPSISLYDLVCKYPVKGDVFFESSTSVLGEVLWKNWGHKSDTCPEYQYCEITLGAKKTNIPEAKKILEEAKRRLKRAQESENNKECPEYPPVYVLGSGIVGAEVFKKNTEEEKDVWYKAYVDLIKDIYTHSLTGPVVSIKIDYNVGEARRLYKARYSFRVLSWLKWYVYDIAPDKDMILGLNKNCGYCFNARDKRYEDTLSESSCVCDYCTLNEGCSGNRSNILLDIEIDIIRIDRPLAETILRLKNSKEFKAAVIAEIF